MFKSFIFCAFLVIWTITEVKSESSRKDFIDGFRKDNSRYWLISCTLSGCSFAFSSCMNCFGERGCKSCISLSKPECSICADDIYNKDDLETIDGNEYLICDSGDPIQSKVCHLYCRGQYAQSGQCVRVNNLPICKCSSESESSTTDSTVTTQITQPTYTTTTSQSSTTDSTVTTQTTRTTYTTTSSHSSTTDSTVTTQTTRTTYATTISQTSSTPNKPSIYFDGNVKKIISFSGDFQKILPLTNGDLVRGSYGNLIEIWDLQKGTIKRNLSSVYNYPSVFGILSNGDLVAGYKNNRALVIWDLKITKGEPLKRIIQTNEQFQCLTILKNEDLAIGYGNGYDIIIRDSLKGLIKKKLVGHTWFVYQIIELPNGNLVSCSADKTVKVWNILNGAVTKSITHTTYVNSITFLQNGYLVSGLGDGTINVWNLETNQLIKNLIGHIYSICYNNCLHILANGDLLSTSYDRTMKVWNPNDGTVKSKSPLHKSGVYQLSVLPSGNFVSSSYDELIVWN